MPRPPASMKKLIEAKRAIIRVAKDRPCADCGQRFPTQAMDFDHLDPADKRCDVSRLANDSHSIKALLAEIQRCEVVCACCHRIRTHSE